METRTCKKCNEIKPIEDFPPHGKRCNGRRHSCRFCLAEMKRVYNDKHREQVRASIRACWHRNGDRYRKQQNEKYAQNPEAAKDKWLKSKFNINLEEYKALKVKQNYKCKVCGQDEDKFQLSLAVDHCHETQKVRGLLCGNCNLGLGRFQDNISYLRSAIEYLKTHQEAR